MKVIAREIIQNKILYDLIYKEKYDFKTKLKIFLGNRPFITILKKQRERNKLYEGELVVVRINKENRIYEFITKIREWGKINIPIKIIKDLSIKNKEKLKIELIKNKEFKNINRENTINLTNIIRFNKKLEIINRNEKYITIYKTSCIPITIPRIIKINEDLIEAIYLLHGDGHYQKKLYFSNKNYDLHKFIINTFNKQLFIPKKLWRYRINHNKRELIDKAKNFWIENLKANKKRFYETRKLSSFNTVKYGNLRSIIDNTIVSEIFNYLIHKIKIDKERLSLIALNGILSAEGNAQIDKKGLHKITIAYNEDEKQMFINLLIKSNLKNFKIEQNKRFCIRKWEHQYKFIKKFLSNNLIPFNKHSERRLNLIIGFLNHSYTRSAIKYLEILKQGKSYEEIAKTLNHRKDSVLELLKKDRYKKFTKKTISGKIKINKRGKEFIEITEKLKNMLKETEKEYLEYIKPINKFKEE
ncbi:hypothetical protein J4216_01630 [Candidatus Woesearchaeota archaeon]|nr:hypothetical protein [Candidatus Woesearchaeota archaeon]